jgi:RNA polymerase sigma factor (TIGR02999 family)
MSHNMVVGATFRRLLDDLHKGNRAALDEMMPEVYAELRRLAEGYMQRERPQHTLQPTALVNEAYLRLVGQESVDWSNRAQVLGVAARMMRRVLLDHASSHNASKRPGLLAQVQLGEAQATALPKPVDIVDLDIALNELQALDPQLSALVELRFFGGLTIDEASEVLGASPATVEREWAAARLWLRRRLSKDQDA